MFTLLFACLWYVHCEKMHEIVLKDSPVAVATDIQQRVYVALNKGKIVQYDSVGNQLAYYSPTQVAEVTTLEARFGVRLYAFYQDLQSFTVFNRFLQPIEQYRLPADKIGFAQTVAWSADRTIWVWDSQDIALKKYNPMTQEVTLQVSLWQVLPTEAQSTDIVRMQEYENRLYIFTAKEVLIMDIWGNWLSTLSSPTLACLHAEKLWALVGKEIQSTNLYKPTEKNSLACPSLPENVLFLHLAPQRLWTFEANKMVIWRL
jgi:hypothetical protein